MTRILIDGDGCPVISIVLKLAHEYQIPTVLYSDTSHEMSRYDGEMIMVDKGKDRVDFEILKAVQKGDLVITQDYGLASLVLSKQAYALSFHGVLFDEENIDFLLTQRYANAKIRKQNKRSEKHKKRTKEDDALFEQRLIEVIEKVRNKYGEKELRNNDFR